uniref:Uncharacterized protein n=1 Tax=Arundo donax TaxID=35708 RepID=A0A0A8YSN5_ARUDO
MLLVQTHELQKYITLKGHIVLHGRQMSLTWN